MCTNFKPVRFVFPDGSMKQTVSELLAQAGFPVRFPDDRISRGTANPAFFSLVATQRPGEFPKYVEYRDYDLAVVGRDCLKESEADLAVLAELPLARAGSNPVRVVLAVREDSPIKNLADLRPGHKIATELPNLARRHLEEHGITGIQVITSQGKTEDKVVNGLVDAIIERTESGSSFRKNRIREVETILVSPTLIVANRNSYNDPELRATIDYLVRKLQGVINARNYVRIEANVPSQAAEKARLILRGISGATVSRMDHAGWQDMMSYILASDEDRVIMELMEIGAKGIGVQRNLDVVML